MADLLPGGTEAEPDAEPRVLGLDSEDADAVLGALSSVTARDLLAAIHEDPATPSVLAERVDTSLQNAQYHLEKLADAGLIEVCGTRYSEKGREMDVYGPSDAPLVLFAGSEDDGDGVETALRHLLGAVGVLAVASLLVQIGLRGVPSLGGGGGGAGSGSPGGFSTTDAPSAGEAAGQAAASLPPGVLFFLGGIVTLAVLGAWLSLRD